MPSRGSRRRSASTPIRRVGTTGTLGFAYYAAGRYTEVVDVLRKEEVGRLPAKRILAASLAQLGRIGPRPTRRPAGSSK